MIFLNILAKMGITKSHIGQTRAYLKTLKLKDGLLVNFPYPDKDEPDFMEINL
ncbi:MAG: GxxExxY protein [Nitrosopumilus sp.]